MLPKAQMPPAPSAPETPAPPGACDAHVHLVAGSEFPLWDGRVEDPAPGQNFDGWLELYTNHLKTLGFQRGLIVHSILYGTDNTITVEAVRRMGPHFKGVGLLPDEATDADLDRFTEQNLVAVRLNYVHGGVLSWEGAKALAPRLRARDLHIQMLLNTHKHMDEIADDIRALPVPLVIDHIGWPDLSLGTQDPGFQTLLALLADGHVHVKLSALYRLCDAPYDQADPFVDALVKANPERLLWGSDWPHLMLADAKMPAAATLLDAFHRVVTDTATRAQILTKTPAKLFGFPS